MNAAPTARKVIALTVVRADKTTTLTAEQARVLTDEIRQTLRVGHELVIQAFQGRAWSALGYSTWDDYCTSEFNEVRMVRLDREQRREIAGEMHAAGMSNRAISSGLGVPETTVRRDVIGAPVGAPDAKVTGADGKSYPWARRAPGLADVEAQEMASATDEEFEAALTAARAEGDLSRKNVMSKLPRNPGYPLPDVVLDAVRELEKCLRRLHRIGTDDRFAADRKLMASRHSADINRLAEELEDFSNLLYGLPTGIYRVPDEEYDE